MDNFFERAVANHQMAVFGLLHSLVRDRELAEDLTQESFVVLYKKVDSIDCSKPILPWLLKTARNLAVNAQRRRKREGTVLMNGQAAMEIWQQLGEKTLTTDWNDHLDALGSCRDELSDAQQKVIDLFYDQGYGCQQIAEAMDTAVPAIHNRLTRARKALMSCILLKLGVAK